MLTWREMLASLGTLCRISFRIVLHRKLTFMALGVVAYYGILYAFAVYRPGEGFSASQALNVLVEIPGTVMAIYLTMDLVAGERDRDTLEVLFSTSSTHYEIWAVRLAVIYVILAICLLMMSTLAYFTFAEFAFVRGGLNAFLPAFLFCNLTFFFSVTCRSGNAAGMLSLGCLIVVLLTSPALSTTPYHLFLNPFDAPTGLEDTLWEDQVLLNRLGVAGAGSLLAFFALRRMERRERLLA